MPLRLMHPSAYRNAKLPFPPATRVDEQGLAAGITRLEQDGAATYKGFSAAFDHLAEQCSASTAPIEHQGDDGPHKVPASSLGPLKKRPRILEKCLNDYANIQPPYGAVCDVVRATLAFASPREMLGAIERLVRLDGNPLFQSSAVRFRIAQMKELYSKNLQSFYGDVKMSLLFFVDGVPDGHVCELQLNTVAMIAAKASKTGHPAYETERTLENTWTKEHPGSSVPRLVDIEEDYALYQADPNDPHIRNYGGQSSGMRDATVADYIDLYRPLIALAQTAQGPARKAFDGHADAPKLVKRIGQLAPVVAKRWEERYAKDGTFTQLE